MINPTFLFESWFIVKKARCDLRYYIHQLPLLASTLIEVFLVFRSNDSIASMHNNHNIKNFAIVCCDDSNDTDPSKNRHRTCNNIQGSLESFCHSYHMKQTCPYYCLIFIPLKHQAMQKSSLQSKDQLICAYCKRYTERTIPCFVF